MKRRLGILFERFRNRADSEHEQALVRLVIASLILAYLWGGRECSPITER
ncbi:MAG: hypothetical protein NT117_13325 [Gammaproteobacteria bacterium]|nr:hypothetical protein [Gammaproteobacteria bacterium]